eukprot:COSAG03_NODE_17497_length_374_cov_0.894545_1_plen_77_part_01
MRVACHVQVCVPVFQQQNSVVACAQRIHQQERSELEQLLQDKVRLEFTPTPEMLALKARVEHLLRSRDFNKAEVARR